MAVSIGRNEITLFDQTTTIVRYEVWFQSPWGLLNDREDAIQRCVANDMDPDSVLIPVSVAIGEGNAYEVVGR